MVFLVVKQDPRQKPRPLTREDNILCGSSWQRGKPVAPRRLWFVSMNHDAASTIQEDPSMTRQDPKRNRGDFSDRLTRISVQDIGDISSLDHVRGWG